MYFLRILTDKSRHFLLPRTASVVTCRHHSMVRNLSSVTPLLAVAGPFNEFPDEFEPIQAHNALTSTKILVVGAGGLGCEILKNLALVGFTDIHVIDMDTVDVSNLNRQFLFRASDVGQSKADCAAAFIRKRVSLVSITSHFCKIQDKTPDFYRQFGVVICGLDNVEARRWINALLVGFVDANMNNLIPLVDGGTEGFRGQARVIIPTVTSCFECLLDMISPKTTYPVCTIANTPRLPEHCVEWASQLEWLRVFPGRKFDADVPGDVDAMHQLALARAQEFGIANVTRALTLGVVKNIIPAIASTNAIVAAACCNEVFKIVTSCNPVLDNYMMYSGDDSIFTYTYAHAKKPSCAVCGSQVKHVRVPKWWTLQHFLDDLGSRQEVMMQAPSVGTVRANLYMRQPTFLEAQTRANLQVKLSALVDVGEEMLVTDPGLPILMKLVVDAFDGPEDEPEDVSSLLRSL